MKIIIPSLRPRNPLVVAVMRRAAGSHRTSERTRRQCAKRVLRRDLMDMKHIP